MAWDDANYTKRMQITVQNANIDANLADFPCLVKLTDTQAVAKADIASKRYDFYDHNGNRLAFEQESYSEGASYANFECWVKVPNLYSAPSGDQNKLWLYYAYDYGSDRDQATGVWDASYKGVWHLAETGTPATWYDSTSNNQDATNTNLTAATGKIGGGSNNNGSSYAGAGSIAVDTSDITAEAWAKQSAGTAYGVLGTWPGAGSSYFYLLFNLFSAGQAQWTVFPFGTENHNATYSPADLAAWNHYVGRADRDGNSELWVNGVSRASVDISDHAAIDLDGDGTFGISALVGTGSYPFAGDVDEVRLSTTKRADAWLKFEYYNMAEADNELTWGSEELYGPLLGPWQHAAWATAWEQGAWR